MTVFQKIIAECDKLFNSGDSAGVEKLLLVSLTEAESSNDKTLQLFIQSELMGHYRMQGDAVLGKQSVMDALVLVDFLNVKNTVSGGTILINAATALSAFGEFNEALELYNRAGACYKNNLAADDKLFAGLYNNMASVYIALADLSEARKLYLQALEILQKNNDLMDSAVTYVNLAQLAYQADELSQIDVFLDKAMELFNAPAAERNGYYAHSCSKCAPVFGFFERENDEKLLMQRAEEFYSAT
jgi:tetratricopeptide (TPR) repeat protein